MQENEYTRCKCGELQPRDSLYCNKCGARLDGKVQCRKCSAWNEPQAVFCGKCGARIDGKRQCPDCGNLLSEEDGFCTLCGAKVGSVRKVNKSEDSGGKSSKTMSQSTIAILQKAKTGVAIALSAITLIFVFLINIGGSFFYEFFGKAYKDIDTVLASMPSSSANSTFEMTLYIPVIFGTIISAATLISVIASAVVSIVNGVRRLTNNESVGLTNKLDGSCARYALVTYALYAAGNILLLAIVHSKVGDEIVVTLGGTSIAGLVVGGVLAAGYLVLALIKKFSESYSADMLTKTIFSFASIALLLTSAILSGFPAIGLKEQGESYMQAGFFVLLSAVGLLHTGSIHESVEKFLVSYTVASIFAFVALCFTVMFIVLAIVDEMNDYDNDKKFPAWSLLATVFSIALLVLSLVAGSMYADAVNNNLTAANANDLTSCTYAVPICLLVFTVLNLAVTFVCRYCRFGKEK